MDCLFVAQDPEIYGNHLRLVSQGLFRVNASRSLRKRNRPAAITEHQSTCSSTKPTIHLMPEPPRYEERGPTAEQPVYEDITGDDVADQPMYEDPGSIYEEIDSANAGQPGDGAYDGTTSAANHNTVAFVNDTEPNYAMVGPTHAVYGGAAPRAYEVPGTENPNHGNKRTVAIDGLNASDTSDYALPTLLRSPIPVGAIALPGPDGTLLAPVPPPRKIYALDEGGGGGGEDDQDDIEC